MPPGSRDVNGRLEMPNIQVQISFFDQIPKFLKMALKHLLTAHIIFSIDGARWNILLPGYGPVAKHSRRQEGRYFASRSP
jgi:hypothetical protein